MNARRARPVVVIGDTLLDVDVDGSVERLCPDAPAPVLAVQGESGPARRGGTRRRAGGRPGRAGYGWSRHWRTTSPAGGCASLLDGLEDGTVEVLAGPSTGGTVVKCRCARGTLDVAYRPRPGRPVAGFAAGRRPGRRARRRRRRAGVGLRSRCRGRPAGARRARAGGRRRVPVVWDPHPRGAGAGARRPSSRRTSARPGARPAGRTWRGQALVRRRSSPHGCSAAGTRAPSR